MALVPASSHSGGNTTAEVVASGKVLPVADATGVTVDTTTYADPFKGGGAKLTTLVFPALPSSQGALALANLGDAYPRWVMAADATTGIYFGDGTYDAAAGGVGLYANSAAQGAFNGRLIVAAAAQGNEAAQLGQLSPLFTITSGALPTVQLVSGTGAQVLTTRDVQTVTPITFNPTGIATATCVVAISPDNVTYSTLVTKTYPAVATLAGAIDEVSIRVPAGWYVKLTVTNAALGLTTYY